MSKSKVRRVNYRVNYCSSQDAEYPVTELVLQSAESKGWQTKRFASYPQTIIIELLELTQVNNISFLCHQNKISTKIEIETKEDHDDNWVRLGYVAPQSGVNTNYQARELRNVNLSNRGVLLFKLTFHQNYMNPINIFNQVGIIALLVYGEKAILQKNNIHEESTGQFLGQISDLDKETILKIKNLEILKKKAVETNDFDSARTYKEDLEKLQSSIKALIILEKQKKEAINNEDFITAKEINERMKRLRGPMVFSAPRNAYTGNMKEQLQVEMSPKRISVNSSMNSYANDNDDPEEKYYRVPQSPHSLNSSRGLNHQRNKSFDLNSLGKNKNLSAVIPHDEVRIKAKGRYFDNNQNSLEPKRIQQKFNSNIPELEEEDYDSKIVNGKKLDRLSHEAMEECQRFFHIFNEVTFEYIFSKDHIYRERGLQIVNEAMEKFVSAREKDKEDFIKASLFVVDALIDDKIIAVLMANVDFFGMMMKKFRPALISGTQKHVKNILEKLSDCLGHNNEKFKQTCEDVYASLPAHGLTHRDLCLQILSNGAKEKSPKVTIGRLKMILRLIKKYNIPKNYAPLILYAKKYLEDRNNDIRQQAVSLMTGLALNAGYQNLFPFIEEMKPQVIKNIEDKIKEEGGVIQQVSLSVPPLNKNQSKSKEKNLNYQQKSQPNNLQYLCDYCKTFDKRLEDENFRDKHLYFECKMIAICKECNQAIEVNNLNQHLVNECANHKYYKKCPKCKEAVPAKSYSDHTSKKSCISGKALALANRCPFCHEDIDPEQKGWLKHLVKEKCPLNPRQ